MSPRSDTRGSTEMDRGLSPLRQPARTDSVSVDTIRAYLTSRLESGRWSGYAWGTIGATTAFIAVTVWWLTQDRSIPIYDAGNHLETAIFFHNLIASGNLLAPLNRASQYPPLGYLVGALGAFVGGINVSSPIVGENLVFVSLLALGCYQTGKLLFGPRAGMLAAMFALGSPLLIAQFHVFMLDAPETALVAVSIWLIVASERFSNVTMSAIAGLAVAAGLLVKVQFPFFVIGIVACALVYGGWRNWRGLAAFAAVAIVLGSPWYIDHFSVLKTIAKYAGTESGAIAGNTPPTLSLENFTWYFWSILNSQLLAPLFLLLVVGTVWLIVRLIRDRGERRDKQLEVFVGACVAWLAITLTPHHDIRYGMPLMPYLAVFATGWIVSVRRAVRWAAIGLLVLGVGMNTLGTTFGVGENVGVALVGSPPRTGALPDRVRFFTDEGFLVGRPRRDGDVPGLLMTLRRGGVKSISFRLADSTNPQFSEEGLFALAYIADLSVTTTRTRVPVASPDSAALIYEPPGSSGPPPCVRLSNGGGVLVVGYDEHTRESSFFCPYRHPAYYK